VITSEQKESIDRTAIKTEQATRPITDREEYYVGRAVAATILGQYRLYLDKRTTNYINRLGNALALASDRPFTYGGYHFAVLDSEEVNALACPGGIVFITRGMLKRTANEEELAAILAHEIAHVNHRDGLAAIKQSRWVEVVATLGSGATRELGGGQLDKLVALFEGSVNDVAKTLIVNGYGRKQELVADRRAMIFMHRLGYDPNGLTDYLAKLARQQETGAGKGFFATHPDMSYRLAEARGFISESNWPRQNHLVRDRRFHRYLNLSKLGKTANE
jgi:predicted Zn-dependent protease